MNDRQTDRLKAAVWFGIFSFCVAEVVALAIFLPRMLP